MSTTATPPKPTSKQTWLQRFTLVLTDLDRAAQGVAEAVSDYAFKGVAVGYLLNEKNTAMTKTGKSETDRRIALVEMVATTGRPKDQGPRTTLQGKPLSWSTISAWMKAAEIESALAEKDPKLVGQLNSDGLAKVASVNSRDGIEAAVAFVQERVENGETSVRQVRAAFDAKYPKTPTAEKSPSERAAVITKDLRDSYKNIGKMFEKLNLDPVTIMPALYFAAVIGGAAKGDAEVANIVIKDLFRVSAKNSK